MRFGGKNGNEGSTAKLSYPPKYLIGKCGLKVKGAEPSKQDLRHYSLYHTSKEVQWTCPQHTLNKKAITPLSEIAINETL